MRILRVLIASMVIFAALSVTGSAMAKQHYPPDVLGTIISRGGTGQAHSEPDVIPRRDPTPVLPFTGSDVVSFLMIATGSILAGTALVRRFRVRQTL